MQRKHTSQWLIVKPPLSHGQSLFRPVAYSCMTSTLYCCKYHMVCICNCKSCRLAIHMPCSPVINNGEVEGSYPRMCSQKWYQKIMVSAARTGHDFKTWKNIQLAYENPLARENITVCYNSGILLWYFHLNTSAR